jgi:pimeloyl-ACP methyl ester carboxylesterase
VVRALGLAGIVTVTLTWAAVADAAQIRLSRGDVHYELTGPPSCPQPGCPLVVLVAGFAVPMVVWDATVPALVEAGFLVLRFDLYGRGRSARPRIEYRPALFAEQIWELVTRLELPHRFDMVASSMGGAIAAAFAAGHPGALDRVVLVGPAGLSHDFPPTVTLVRTPGLGKWYFTSRFRELMLDHLQDNVRANVCVYPKVLAEFRRQLEVPGSAQAMFSTLRHTVLADARDDFQTLGRRHLRTLAIWGMEDRLVPFDETVRELRQLIPHLKVARIAGAAHLPQLERPRTFNALVTGFLLSP